MEKSPVVDQKHSARLEAVRGLLAAASSRLAAQGAVVESWRHHREKRLGPYYRLAYRDGGRQCSLYLGRDACLADEVRRLLREAPQSRRWAAWLRRQRRAVARSLAAHKRVWREELAACGLRLKGNEVRGWRHVNGPSFHPAISQEDA